MTFVTLLFVFFFLEWLKQTLLQHNSLKTQGENSVAIATYFQLTLNGKKKKKQAMKCKEHWTMTEVRFCCASTTQSITLQWLDALAAETCLQLGQPHDRQLRQHLASAKKRWNNWNYITLWEFARHSKDNRITSSENKFVTEVTGSISAQNE